LILRSNITCRIDTLDAFLSSWVNLTICISLEWKFVALKNNSSTSLRITNVLDVAFGAIEVFITLITNIRIFWTAFSTVHYFGWALIRRLSWGLAIWQIVTLFTNVTCVWSLTRKTIIQTNDNLTIFTCIAIHTFGTYPWCWASTNTLIRTDHMTLFTCISRFAWFASFLIAWKTLVTILNITL